MSLESDYLALEKLQETFNKAQKVYFQTRYLFWSALHSIKKHSALKVPYKRFEAIVRNDCKKKQGKNLYGKRPRGCHLDHKIPVIYYYCASISDLEVINSKDNCVWLKKKDNLQKGIKRNESNINI